MHIYILVCVWGCVCLSIGSILIRVYLKLMCLGFTVKYTEKSVALSTFLTHKVVHFGIPQGHSCDTEKDMSLFLAFSCFE